MRKLYLSLILMVTCHAAFAQPTLQQKLYYTCKVWGFVKYFHSGVSTCSVNWDSVLLHTLPLIRNASTNNEFNDALDTMLAAAGPMALSTTYFPDTLSPALKRNRDWSWISSPVFRSDVKTILDTIKNNFRPHSSCWAAYNFGTGGSTWGGYLKFPYDSTILNINTTSSYPDSNNRQLMLFKLWNIVRYYNPYNYVLDVPWDTTLLNYVIPIDTVKTSLLLYEQYLKIATALDDAHVYGLTWSTYYQTVPGEYRPRILLNYLGGKYVVVKSQQAGINAGDIIVAADGLTTAQLETNLRQYYSAGNMSVFRRTMCQNMLGRKVNGTTESIVVTDSTGTNHTVSAVCVNPSAYSSFFYTDFYPVDSISTVRWTTLNCDIGYVNMGNLETTDVSAMYDDLMSKTAIIFDIRNYPNGTAWDIADLMYPTRMQFSKLTEPDLNYPGTYSWYEDWLGVIGNPTPYTGKVIILMNQETQSQAEYSCMILGAMPGAVKVGSQTAAADGNVTWISFSNDLRFGWTSLGVYYPNGDSTQRIGIVPDSVVYPTRAGIRNHRGEVLEKALSIAGCNLSANNTSQAPVSIKVFPNPATDKITVELNNITEQEVSVNVTDLTGRILLSHNMENTGHASSAIFNIKSLPTGMYFVTVQAGGRHYATKIVKE